MLSFFCCQQELAVDDPGNLAISAAAAGTESAVSPGVTDTSPSPYPLVFSQPAVMGQVKLQATATCFCGSVRLAIEGRARKKILCHCKRCQSWLGGPCFPAIVFAREQVTIHGEVISVSTSAEGALKRLSCARCYSHVLCDFKAIDCLAVCAGLFSDDFQPQEHHCWPSRMLTIDDDLKKFQDFPKELGGTGNPPLPSKTAAEDPLRVTKSVTDDLVNASCYCGSVKLRIEGRPCGTTLCHCEHCRKWTGSTSCAEVIYFREQVTVKGEVRSLKRSDKCQVSVVNCCAKCFGAVCSWRKENDSICGVNAGLLPGSFEPDFHLY
eukprot:TRINITY_DN35228_c0_g1_i1.p1 TRINITY_DN35228_c0_g1~~TRINITY_DN35228_c0_g1_i1.p1  ORF type:complete len:323 (-),score=53.63 TRINITY_DN35228_c0_g1_i1:94-1062(-)